MTLVNQAKTFYRKIVTQPVGILKTGVPLGLASSRPAILAPGMSRRRRPASPSRLFSPAMVVADKGLDTAGLL